MRKLDCLKIVLLIAFVTLCVTGCGGGGGSEPTPTTTVTVDTTSINYTNTNLVLSVALDFSNVTGDKVTFSNLKFVDSSNKSIDLNLSAVFNTQVGTSVRYYIKGKTAMPSNTTESNAVYTLSGSYKVGSGTLKTLPAITITIAPDASTQSLIKIAPTGTVLDPMGDLIQVKVKLDTVNKDKALTYSWTVNGGASSGIIVKDADNDVENPTTGKERIYTQRIKLNDDAARTVILTVSVGTTKIGTLNYTQAKATPPSPAD